MQKLHAVAYGNGRRVWPEILGPTTVQAAAVIRDTGKLILADEDVGVGLIVAKKDVIAWIQALDQVVLKQERLGFGACNRGFNQSDLPHHQGNAGARVAVAKIRSHALLQGLGFADIKHVACRIQHAVDAGQVGQ